MSPEKQLDPACSLQAQQQRLAAQIVKALDPNRLTDPADRPASGAFFETLKGSQPLEASTCRPPTAVLC